MTGKMKTKAAHALLEQAGGADYIFGRVAEGATLKALAAELGVSRPVLSAWCNADARLDGYARARHAAAAHLAEDMLEIADQATPETERTARLRIDSRKWIASRLDPATWGDARTGQSVTINLGELHLQAVRRASPSTVDTDVTEADPGTVG